MSIDIRDNYDIESFYQGFEERFSSEDMPEEKTCARCLEIESECLCHLYDKIEEVELSRERAEDAMSRLKPVSMEIMSLHKT